MDRDLEKLNAITGPVAVGSSAITVGSFVTAIVSFFSGEWVIARASLTAAGLSLGLLANAIYLGARLSHRKPQSD